MVVSYGDHPQSQIVVILVRAQGPVNHLYFCAAETGLIAKVLLLLLFVCNAESKV